MTTRNEGTESQMLQRVREWRRQAYEARQRAGDKARESEEQELLRTFGLTPPKQEDGSKHSAA